MAAAGSGTNKVRTQHLGTLQRSLDSQLQSSITSAVNGREGDVERNVHGVSN